MNKDSLNNYSKKIFSQFGEDGIILEILNRLTKKNLDFWCVEFGARDGISDSNTLNLIKNYKYKAVLIEGDKKYFKICVLVIFSRKGYDNRAKKSILLKKKDFNNIIFVNNKKFNISSTMIKRKLI